MRTPKWGADSLHKDTWRLVAAYLIEGWTWAVLRSWHSNDGGRTWACLLDYRADQVRGGRMDAWYPYDPELIVAAPERPPAVVT